MEARTPETRTEETRSPETVPNPPRTSGKPAPLLTDELPAAVHVASEPDDRENLTEHLEGLSTAHEDDFRASSLARRLLRVSRGGRVLDAGCGTGLLSLELLRAGNEVVAVDHEDAMVRISTQTFRKGGFPGVQARELSVEHLDRLGNASFDEIFCCDVVEHVRDDRKAMGQIRSLLRPDGRLILTVPAWPFLFGERDRRMGHYRRYSRRMLRELFRDSGFHLESLRWWNLSGFLLNALLIRMLRIEFSEKFRYERKEKKNQRRNSLLYHWFHGFENHVPVPFGLTLIAVGSIDHGRSA